jgi:hypothetical protein
VTPEQISQAIAAALSDAGEQILEGTLAAVLPILWLLTLALHLGRPYMTIATAAMKKACP